MPIFSKKSLYELSTCDKRLQDICNEIIKYYDITIIKGFMNEEETNRYYDEGKSKLRWPNAKHNKVPSLAIDISIYPIDWNNIEAFYYLAGLFQGIARIRCIKIRWGGDWNRNNNFKDETFHDLGHFEIDE